MAHHVVAEQATHQATAPGTLYIVSTPIGNLADLSHRAVAVLGEVRTILAEDTRHSRTLLAHYAITTPLHSYHEHNEAQESPRAVARLAAGESLALISDAGTPLLSDPGARLVQAAVSAGVPVVAVPGASALLAALVASGLAGERFTFFGFLPRSGVARTSALHAVATLGHVAVVYEAPGRVAATLAALADAGAESRLAVVARELTKKFEEIRRGTVRELAAYYGERAPRGEVVLVVEGAGDVEQAPGDEALRMRAEALRGTGARPRDVMAALIAAGAPRNVAYQLAHESPAAGGDA